MRFGLIAALLVFPAAAGSTGDTLVDRMNRFAGAYNDFTAALSHGIYDARQAKRLSGFWREVETSGDWPASGSR